MNRKALVIAVALLAVVILAASVNTALAETVYTDHEYAGGNSIIDVPGQTIIRLIISGRMEGDYYSGKADRIQINVHTGQFNAAGLPVFKQVAAYEDNPTRNAFSVGLSTGQVQNLVKPWQIQIVRICKTCIVYWTVPLVAPATDGPNPTPAVTLPPGFLVLRGYGEAHSMYIPPTSIGTTGWKVEINNPSYYNATATLFCPGWRYCGPVAEDYVGAITHNPRVVTDRTWTWTHP